MMTWRRVMSVLTGALVALAGSVGSVSAVVSPTNESIFVYDTAGTSTFKGGPVQVGSVIDAYDDDGVHCGTVTVGDNGEGAGYFAAMAVYKDDPETAGVDEGADVNDEITFKIDGEPAQVTRNGPVQWDGNGVTHDISLDVPHAVVPTDASIFVYDATGGSTLRGAPVPVGAVIDAYDPDGVRCGTVTVGDGGEAAGYFAAMPVYADDGSTVADEGATVGDAITFRINGEVAKIIGGPVIWDANGTQYDISLDVPHAVVPTDEYIFVYDATGGTTVSGAPVPVGAVIDAYDPDGVRCGTVTVGDGGEAAGYFAAMPVYADDGSTVADEGATVGDAITFKISGQAAQITRGGPVTWDANGTQYDISLDVAYGVVPTDEYIFVYDATGGSTVRGAPVPVGAVIDAFDPDGVRCGTATVGDGGEAAGYFAAMAVYGDDVSTVADEGATVGDAITFKINNEAAQITSGGPVIWTVNGAQYDITLDVSHGVVPTDEYIFVYDATGGTTVSGAPVPIGAVIDAYDPDGVRCGTVRVGDGGEAAGYFAAMAVYADDDGTGADEGATVGDAITFKIDNEVAQITSGGPVIWDANGSQYNISLNVPSPVTPPLVTPTNEFIFVYDASGGSTVLGAPVPVGAVIDAYDPDGVRCGTVTVGAQGEAAGYFAAMAVYRDDILTSGVDEGAVPGDVISFKINDQAAVVIRNGPVIWDADGSTYDISLDVPPSVTPTNEYVFVYDNTGGSLFMGSAVPVGAVIDAYDPDGVRCGTVKVGDQGEAAGYFAAMAVYRDDILTPGVDEGAVPGNEITFRINGQQAVVIRNGPVFWDVDGSAFDISLGVFGPVMPTNESIFVYDNTGTTTFHGGPVPVGAIIDAFDADGVRCGSIRVGDQGESAGYFAAMAVYRDDDLTSGVDEGASVGDTLTFRINGQPAWVVRNGPDVIWDADGSAFDISLDVPGPVLLTNEFIFVYDNSGLSTYYGVALPTGSIVDAYDADGVRCGTVKTGDNAELPGYFASFPVYKDDLLTPLVDEGAAVGDEITFRINGQHAVVTRNGPVTWDADGSTYDISLEVASYTPTGAGVVVTPVDPATGDTPASLTFDNVVTPGVTSVVTVEPADLPEPIPAGYESQVLYDIETTCSFTANVELTFRFPEPCATVAVWDVLHYVDPAWLVEPRLSATCSGDYWEVTTSVSSLSPFAVVKNLASKVLKFQTQPGGSVSGLPLATQPVVIADDGGSPDVTYNDTVTLSLESGDGTLVATFSKAVSGVATFAGVVYTANADGGKFQIRAVDGSATFTDVVSDSVASDVVGTQLMFTTMPAGSVSGAALATQPVVAAVDADTTTDADFSGSIVLSGAATAGTLSGTFSKAASGGVATWTDIVFTAAVDHETFTVQAAFSGLTTATSPSIASDVVATQLVFSTQPAGAANLFSLTTQPVVEAQDGDNTRDLDFTETVTLSATPVTGGGTLLGTVSVAASSGVATFTTVRFDVDTNGDTFYLTANDQDGVGSNLPAANSNTIAGVKGGTATIEIPLIVGFNSVSWNVTPASDSTRFIMDSLLDSTLGDINLKQILGYETAGLDPNAMSGGTKFNPSEWVDAIWGDFFATAKICDPRQGFWIQMNHPDTLVIEGVPVSLATSIPLVEGFNRVGYLPSFFDTTRHALADLIDPVTPNTPLKEFKQILGYETPGLDPNAQSGGTKFNPAEWVDATWGDFFATAKRMAPGQGFWLQREQGAPPTTFVYASSPQAGTPQTMAGKIVATASSREKHVYPTIWWMGMHGWLTTSDGERAPSGTVVDVVDGEGNTAGRFEIEHLGGYGYMPVYLDDPESERDEGADQDEWLTVRVNGHATDYRVQWKEFGDEVRLDMEVDIMPPVSAPEGLPREFALQQSYPNPFNAETTVSYQLPREASVSLSVYNLSGQRIRWLVREAQKAGVHTVSWDGLDDSMAPVASGIYFYRLQSDSFQQTRKMVLIR